MVAVQPHCPRLFGFVLDGVLHSRADPELATGPEMTLSLWPSCVHLLNGGMMDMDHLLIYYRVRQTHFAVQSNDVVGRWVWHGHPIPASHTPALRKKWPVIMVPFSENI